MVMVTVVTVPAVTVTVVPMVTVMGLLGSWRSHGVTAIGRTTG
jgi:hypothetical protein